MGAVIGTDLDEAARLLAGSALVAIPTETVYGLAANALDPKAVARIFEAKDRPFFDPLIVHIASAEALNIYAREVPEAARKLAEAFWPGPLTLILPRDSVIPDLVTSGNDTVGLRMPRHPLTLDLLSRLPFPLAAPSANPFGYISPTTAAHVAEQLGSKIDYILDGGACQVGVESTIVGFPDGKPVIYRLGGLKLEALEEVCGKVELQIQQSGNPQAPGQLLSHYAPRKPLYIGNIPAMLTRFPNQMVSVISFERTYTDTHIAADWVLSPGGNLEEAAARLFSVLREADAAEPTVILAEEAPDYGLGRAINDRLRRASVRF